MTVLLATVAAAQEGARLDKELTILESDAVLEGLGPSSSVSWSVHGDGSIFIWAESDDFDPFLQVESADGTLRMRNDDDGGGTTAWIRAPVLAGAALRIQVAAKDGAKVGHARLRIREMPESAESKQAVEDAEATLAEAREFAQANDLRVARELLAPAVDALLDAPGVECNSNAHRILWQIATALFGWGDTAMNLKICQALVRFEADRYPPICRARIQVLSEVCGILAQVDRGDEALPSCEQALVLAERAFGARSLEAAIVRYNLGLTWLAKRDPESARELLESAARDFRRLRGADDENTAMAEVSLGTVLNELGELDEARRYQEHAVEVLTRKSRADDPSLRAAQNNLASTLSALGDDRAARASHRKLLAVALRMYEPDHAEVLRARHNVGIDMLRLGEFAEANAEFSALAQTFRRLHLETGADAELADVALADSLDKLGRHQEALAVVESRRGIRVARGLQDATCDRRLCAISAQALLGMGQLERALQQAEAALVAATRALPPDNPDLADVRQMAAGLNMKLGHQDRAYELTRQSALDSQGYLARCATTLSMGQAEAAQAHWSRLVSDGIALLDATAPSTERAEADALAFELTESARGIGTALLRCARVSSVGGIEALRRKVRDSAREVANLGGGDPDAPALEAAIAEKERAERGLRAALTDLVGPEVASARPNAAAIARSLAPDEALIAWWRSDVRALDAPQSAAREARLCAFVLRAGHEVRRVELGRLAPITDAVSAWREAVASLDADGPAREVKAGEQLRRLVVDPLFTAAGDAARWRVALDDALNTIALDALPFERGRLGDRLRIVASPTCERLSAASAVPAAPDGFLALGGIDYDFRAVGSGASEPTLSDPGTSLAPSIRNGVSKDGFGALWETRDEIDALTALFKRTHVGDAACRRLGERDATKSALMQAAPRASCIHIATHGFFALKDHAAVNASEAALAERSPLALCGLALTGANAGPDDRNFEGLITAEELATLDLSHCQVFVLSACDSNVGLLNAGQGLASFQKALHAAGAQVVVTSLWKVSDEATRTLMVAFYKGMWEEKLSPEAALWRAKSQCISRRAPLRDWAGWVLSRQ